MAPLPLLFMILASVALLLALIALWSSLRTALVAASGQSEDGSLAQAELPDRAALIDEKKSLLRAIKDLEYEHAVGKIAAEDFERLNHAYRLRAKEVLSLLEKDLLPYQARAEALLAKATGVPPIAREAGADDDPSEARAPAAPEPATQGKPPHDKDAAEEPPSEATLRDRARALREEAERLEKLAAASETETSGRDGAAS